MRDALQETIRLLKLDLQRIRIFGDFSLDDIDYIRIHGNRVLQFFCSKKGNGTKLTLCPELVYIGTDHTLNYYIAINAHAKVYEGMIEMKIEVPAHLLRQQLQKAEVQKQEIEHKLQSLNRFNHYLHQACIAELNSANLGKAEKSVKAVLEDSLFVTTGWVPENKVESLTILVQEFGIVLDEVKIEPQDTVPTYLENSPFSRLGEDVIQIYDTPSRIDKDPSFWVLIGFVLFFSMIIGDAGYGLAFLGIALYLRYKFPLLKGMKKRMLKLLFLLCAGCIGWGSHDLDLFRDEFISESHLAKGFFNYIYG